MYVASKKLIQLRNQILRRKLFHKDEGQCEHNNLIMCMKHDELATWIQLSLLGRHSNISRHAWRCRSAWWLHYLTGFLLRNSEIGPQLDVLLKSIWWPIALPITDFIALPITHPGHLRRETELHGYPAMLIKVTNSRVSISTTISYMLICK